MGARVAKSVKPAARASARIKGRPAAKEADWAEVISLRERSLLLGVRLRHARMSGGMRLNDLARKVGCSESLLSKLENSMATPSINMLHRIANALGTNLAWLLAPAAGEDNIVLRKERRPTLNISGSEAAKGIVLQALIAHGQGHLLQAQVHVLEPGAMSDGEITHEGEEVGLVLEGLLELRVNGKSYRLSTGDSFHFESSLPHAYGNPGHSVTQVVWINTPPTY